MKKIIEILKRIALSVVAWFNRWPKDLILHFTLADDIQFITWIIGAVTLGLFVPIKWVFAASAAVTLCLVVIKDCVLDTEADWRDIAAGIGGLLWSLFKLWLAVSVLRLFFC